MSDTRKKYTTEQIELAVDYIAEKRTNIFHPEDRDLGFFTSYDRILKKVEAMTEQERIARNERAVGYITNFKKALINYFQRTQCSCVISDYAVQDTDLQDAVKGTNVCFDSGLWEVRLTEDGKVFSHSGKYDFKGTEVARKAKVALEEPKTSISTPGI
jgi:hypothetical protein